MCSKLIPIFLLSSFLCMSQENININYHDSTIETLINHYKTSQTNAEIKVYRIQLESSRLEERIINKKKKYEELKIFKDESIYAKYEQPEFKLVTGTYSDKKIAEKKLRAIKQICKQAFIFEETISMEMFNDEKN